MPKNLTYASVPLIECCEIEFEFGEGYETCPICGKEFDWDECYEAWTHAQYNEAHDEWATDDEGSWEDEDGGWEDEDSEDSEDSGWNSKWEEKWNGTGEQLALDDLLNNYEPPPWATMSSTGLAKPPTKHLGARSNHHRRVPKKDEYVDVEIPDDII